VRIFKIVVVTFFSLLGVAALGLAYLYLRSPASAPTRDIHVSMAPERIERGRYIFENLGGCNDCHSGRDFSKLGGPVIPSQRGEGQVMPLNDLPGRIVAANITMDRDTGIGSWSDGEKIRAIREGIDKDGRPLFPLMPYAGYRYMTDDDVESLVAYLDTLPPVHNSLPPTDVDFPVSLFVKSAPRPVDPKPAKLDRGEYLVTIAGCEECHTPMVRGQSDTSMRYAGGRVFATPYGTVLSANITSDLETGIGKWDFARFHDRIEGYRQFAKTEYPKVGPDRFTMMPWIGLSGLTDPDLEAIFAYIKTRTAIEHKVETHPGS
jgi:hypothetical protein